MIIKIMTDDEKYFMSDNVINFHYSKVVVPPEGVDLVIGEASTCYNQIYVQFSDYRSKTICFTQKAYICNDKGDTIGTIPAVEE